MKLDTSIFWKKLMYSEPIIYYQTNCPKCSSKIKFDYNGDIYVNCISEGRVDVPGLLTLAEGCSNPLCEWSKVNGRGTYY